MGDARSPDLSGLSPDSDAPSGPGTPGLRGHHDSAADLQIFKNAPSTVDFKKRRKRLARQTEEAIAHYDMAAPIDGRRPRWLVGLSGGKDSYTLLATLLDLRAQHRLDVDLLACNLDQCQPGFPKETLPNFLTATGVPFRIETKDTYTVVKENTPAGATLCTLCSRLRRGHLYRVAREEGCDAVVLGHHRDDILETFFLNLFFGGRLETMPPKLLNDEQDLLVLRPLAFAAEDDIAKFARAMAFPIIPCTLCGTQEGLQRQEVKSLLDLWEIENPGRRQTIFRALMTARPSHLLDAGLFDFKGLAPAQKIETAADAPAPRNGVGASGD